MMLPMRPLLGSCVLVLALNGCDSEGTSDGGAGGSGATSTTGSVTSGGENVEAEMLAAHNAARANVSPAAATPIPPLEWSKELADIATAYAKECKFEHSENPDYGENLFASSVSTKAANVVKPWVDEKADYDYASNTCAAEKVCGHYTQVVWADSRKVGCGFAECTENTPFMGAPSPRWYHWVCNYDPPGNYVGQKPY